MSDVAVEIAIPEPFWTAERIARLATLWADPDMTASAIAVELETSKNAIIGKVHRIGLPPRVVLVRSTRKELLDLFPASGLCRYPIGHPGEDGFHFCAAEAIEFLPYCYPHYRVTHIPQSATDARSAAWSEVRRIKAQERLLERLRNPR